MMDEKSIVFHRKALFDTDREKLLVLCIRIKINQSEMENELRLLSLPTSFSILINEPESEQSVEFMTSLESCLTADELSGNCGDLKELKVIRKLARLVLEDRIDIRRNFANDSARVEDGEKEGDD